MKEKKRLLRSWSLLCVGSIFVGAEIIFKPFDKQNKSVFTLELNLNFTTTAPVRDTVQRSCLDRHC
jgi:hypothetical protein